MPSLPMPTKNQENLYAIDKELYDSAVAIREELNLLAERLSKMDTHKGEVSEAVYLKVKTDYLARQDRVKKSFEEKKLQIQKALRVFYKGKHEQEEELQKHREVLEEAKFRSFLGEYTDKKFKEVEGRENDEIKRFENVLAIIQGNIKQYEELIGGPLPELEAPPPPAAKTEIPKKEAATPVSKIKEDTGPEIQMGELDEEEKAARETMESYLVGGEEGDYFQSGGEEPAEILESKTATKKTKAVETTPSIPEKLKTQKVHPIKPAPPLEEGPTSKNTVTPSETVPASGKAPARDGPQAPGGAGAPKVAAKSSPAIGFDDSISSILRSIPLDEGEESAESKREKEKIPEGPSITEVEEKATGAKLICLEGDLEPPEFELGENTSLGRSPSNDIILKEAKVSRQHAAINLLNGNHVLVDLKSSNGVYVNGDKIEECILEDGDEITIGGYRLLYKTS